jgi:pimeloyl-ACP methyl ester carboxylesterase
MPSGSNNAIRPDVSLYLIAGVKTAPHFMEEFRQELHGKLESAGAAVRSRLLFPYGDWTRKAVPQLWEIRRDIGLAPRNAAKSIGGNRVLEAIRSDEEETGSRRRPILVGHSGGGVAAVHAAQLLLEREGGRPSPVVMVGAPRCRIAPELRSSVLYVFAEGKSSGAGRPRPSDPVVRLGTFGGWEASRRFRLPVWNAGKHAPAERRPVPILGGHADYFRSRPPFVSPEGRTNLELIVEEAWRWLARHESLE